MKAETSSRAMWGSCSLAKAEKKGSWEIYSSGFLFPQVGWQNCVLVKTIDTPCCQKLYVVLGEPL